MENEPTKSPDEYAEREINIKIGKAIAKRKMKISKLQDEIKRLKTGEMSPDEDDDSSSHDNKKKVIVERIIEIERERPARPMYEPTWKPYYGTYTTTCDVKSWNHCDSKINTINCTTSADNIIVNKTTTYKTNI